MNSNQSLQTPKLVGAVVITAVLLIGIYFLILHNKPVTTTAVSTIGSTTPQTTPTADTSNTTAMNTADQASTSYKDGVYTATADYQVPHDTNSIQVTLSVKDNIVTAVDTKHSYEDEESVRYINGFVSAVSGEVVGKKLDAAQVGRINGASDTAEGFNDALNTIIAQAKA